MTNGEQMIVEENNRVYHIKPSDHKNIIKFLQESPDRYLDVRDFISKAIEIFYTWETNPKRAEEMLLEMEQTIPQLAKMKVMMKPEAFENLNGKRLQEEPELTEKIDEFLQKHPEYVSSAAQNQKMNAVEAQQIERRSQGDLQKLIDSKKNILKFIQDTDFNKIILREEQTEIGYDGWPLLWNYYTRILPAKIAIMAIAERMYKNNTPIIELDEKNKAHIYDIIEEVSAILRDWEKDNKITREAKLSTGLPKPDNPDRPGIMREEVAKIINAISRYKDKIIGKPRKSQSDGVVSFDGMLSALGLVRTFIDKKNKKVYMTLTEAGKKFCLLENPVINEDYTSAFSVEERKFLITKIISQRDLEYRLVKAAIKIVKSHSKNNATVQISKSLDDEFEAEIKEYLKLEIEDWVRKDISNNILKIHESANSDKKQTPIQAYRIATMGRLAEIGLFKWNIQDDASSSYTIADPVTAEEILK